MVPMVSNEAAISIARTAPLQTTGFMDQALTPNRGSSLK